MNTTDILFIGVNGHVIAFNKHDGSKIWQAHIRRRFPYSGDCFVTVLVESERVYAHTYGELFCLDARTGKQLWTDELAGLGYDIATLAVIGNSPQLLAAKNHKHKERDSGGG